MQIQLVKLLKGLLLTMKASVLVCRILQDNYILEDCEDKIEFFIHIKINLSKNRYSFSQTHIVCLSLHSRQL